MCLIPKSGLKVWETVAMPLNAARCAQNSFAGELRAPDLVLVASSLHFKA